MFPDDEIKRTVRILFTLPVKDKITTKFINKIDTSISVLTDTFSKIKRGINFWMVLIIKTGIIGLMLKILTNHPWKGATPILRKIGNIILTLSMPEVSKACLDAKKMKRKKIEATLCDIKYLNITSLWAGLPSGTIKGRTATILTSRATHKKNKLLEEAPIIREIIRRHKNHVLE